MSWIFEEILVMPTNPGNIHIIPGLVGYPGIIHIIPGVVGNIIWYL